MTPRDDQSRLQTVHRRLVRGLHPGSSYRVMELDTFSSLLPRKRMPDRIVAPPAAQPSLLQQAIGAAASAVGLDGALGQGAGAPSFSIDVRGQRSSSGTPYARTYCRDTSDTVVQADMQSIRSSFGVTTITGTTGMQKLATTRINQIYSNQH